MTAIELNTQKVNLIKDILDETNEDVSLELVTYLKQVRKKNYPCNFTDTEKQERIEQSVRDAGAGLGITQETMINALLRSKEDIENGNIYTQEQLREKYPRMG